MSDKLILPLTRAEVAGKKQVYIVRAAARIAIAVQRASGPECLFVRHQAKGLELPGGAIEPGETPLQACLRELREEAGLSLPNDQPLTPVSMQPIIDHRGGHWLDIIYATVLMTHRTLKWHEGELPVLWLRSEEIEKQVNTTLSSYTVSLKFLEEMI